LRKKNNKLSKLFTSLLIISPILAPYQISGISFGFLGLLLIVPLIVLFELRIGVKWAKYFWFYFIYIILTRIFYADGLYISNLFSFSVISFVILTGLSGQYFNLKYAVKIYRKSVLFCVSFFVFQELMFYTVGYRLVGLLPFDIYGNESYDVIKLRLSAISRSSSFFHEPSYFSEYLIPLLAIELFNSKNNKLINISAISISIVLLFLKSGLGIAIMSILWVIWIIYSLKKFSFNKKLIIIFILIPILLLGSFFYIKSEIGDELLLRTEEFGIVDGTTSTYVRIIRGYDLYSEFITFNKVFGLNSSFKIQSLIESSSMYNLFPTDDLSFNSVQSILIYGGFFGLLLFFLHFNYLFRKNTIEGKLLAIAFLLLSLIAAIYLKPTMLLIYSFMFGFHKQYLNSRIDYSSLN